MGLAMIAAAHRAVSELQRGDQQFVAGNDAVLHHTDEGRDNEARGPFQP
jgi:hypothetical protein